MAVENYPGEEFLFQKELKDTHVRHRLDWPHRHLGKLIDLNRTPDGDPHHLATLRVFDVQRQKVLHFGFTTRTTGNPKPVISSGWLEFVRAHSLQVGDKVQFYRSNNPNLSFTIRFTKAS